MSSALFILETLLQALRLDVDLTGKGEKKLRRWEKKRRERKGVEEKQKDKRRKKEKKKSDRKREYKNSSHDSDLESWFSRVVGPHHAEQYIRENTQIRSQLLLPCSILTTK